MDKEGIERTQDGRSQFHDHVVQSELMLPQILSAFAKQPSETDDQQHLAQGHSRQLQQSRDRNQQQQMLAQENRGSDWPELVPVSPISSRPPSTADSFFNQALVPVTGSLLVDDLDAVGGDESEKGYPGGGSRWPRQETLALLKIRSDMDALFRDASLKSPLWEHVSRKLAELGYHRSAKKCKEKFENVYKYYRRTKGRRSGRLDGKSYRFFSQLEALYGNKGNNIAVDANNHERINNNNNNNNGKSTVANGESSRVFLGEAAVPQTGGTTSTGLAMQGPLSNAHSSAGHMSLSPSESSDDDDDHNEIRRKRKRTSTKKTMIFFEKLMHKVMEKQELMQQRFLETIEKREHDRLIREEAWKRQEMARLNRENEARARERALSASRDTALVAFLQKVTGQTLQLPQLPVTTAQQPNAQETIERLDEDQFEEGSLDPNGRRWPKAEIHALIKLRSGFETRFHGAGPKGHLWVEISARMDEMGYHRTAKRCKEKWENINKYFKKARESNKERPENANTCPYFHQLDALYRKGILGNSPNVKPHIKDRNGDDQREELTCGTNRDDHSPRGCGDMATTRASPTPDPTNNVAAVPPYTASNGRLDICSHSYQQGSQEAEFVGGERALKKVKMKQQSDNIIIASPVYEVSGSIPENVDGSELLFSGNSNSTPLKVPDSDLVTMDGHSTLQHSVTDENDKSTERRDQNLEVRKNHEKQADLDLPSTSVYNATINNIPSADARDAGSASSIMAMIHKLTADPPRLNMSGSSNAL